jgi:hypothetical protein
MAGAAATAIAAAPVASAEYFNAATSLPSVTVPAQQGGNGCAVDGTCGGGGPQGGGGCTADGTCGSGGPLGGGGCTASGVCGHGGLGGGGGCVPGVGCFNWGQ